MDFSAANTELWSPIIQFGIIAGLLLIANVLRRKIPFIRRSLIPTSLLGGLLILLGLQLVLDDLGKTGHNGQQHQTYYD